MVPDSVSLPGRYRLFMDASLSLSLAVLILLGMLLSLLGFLLIPVNLGLIPFSPDGQLGLLMVINAIQMMALGETPVGQYRRSWLMILLGIIFAGLGIFSCIIPGILTDLLRILLGVLNIAGGVLLLGKRYLAMFHDPGASPAIPADIALLLTKLQNTQAILSVVSIAFGITMLIPGFVSGLIIAVILIMNGLLLFLLGSIIQKLPPA